MTLTDIYESRLDKEGNKGPLYPFDETTKETTDTVTGSWYLESDLYISQGSKLVVQGESFTSNITIVPTEDSSAIAEIANQCREPSRDSQSM